MKKLACRDLSETTCTFAVEGATEEEAARKMLVHAREHHSADIASMSDEDVVKMFVPKVHD